MTLSDPFLLLLFLLPFAVAVVAAAGSEDAERHALLDIKARLRASDPERFSSWLPSSTPCAFGGVTCDSAGAVAALDLSSSRLSGDFPFDAAARLPSLTRLDLASNSLSGELPAGFISSLASLQVLNISGNRFSGEFPWWLMTNLSGLISLVAGDNPFRPSRLPAEIADHGRLSELYLSNCSLIGEIPPAIGNLTGLIRLELSHNQLTGEIPPEIGRLNRLRILELYENMLAGGFPAGFGNLTALELFDASTNLLEGDLSELRSLTNLVSLQIFNNSLSGEIPAEFGEFRRLVNISLYGNGLSGGLPEKLGSWSEVNYIDVSDNQLTGPIPPGMCRRGTMREVLMLNNHLSGEIPAAYGDCVSLKRIRLSHNNLSGEVPAKLWGLPKLNLLDLESNQFHGAISPAIGSAANLSSLLIAGNSFTGELPQEIARATALILLDAAYNRLYGEIPPKIGDLKKLNALYLQSNQLSGAIPSALGQCSSLNQINLADNSFSGEIPSTLADLRSLNLLNLSDNRLEGVVPTGLGALKLSLLDLSNNQLAGPVPDSLSNYAYSRSFLGNPGLCSTTARNLRPCAADPGRQSRVRTLAACFAAGAAVLLASLGCFLFSLKSRTRNNNSVECSVKPESWRMNPYQVLTFSEEEILAGILRDNLIGKGGSGDVYRVRLRDGTAVAVKHIWRCSGRGTADPAAAAMLAGRRARSPEFEAEVAALSSVRHVNVVKLFCSVTSEDSNLLVYEYLPRGSLWDRLHPCEGKPGLGWPTRYEIAVGSARGLEYLHHGCGRPIVHRDVKSSNILLDDLFKPRIADFGLAKIVQTESWSESSNIIPGTYGYIAPEYGYTCRVTEKTDVYSFGVVLMELATGKRPVELEFGENKDIVGWVLSAIRSGESVSSLVDSQISEPCNKEDATKVLQIAIICTARLPVMRPTMRAVVQMLEEVAQSSPVRASSADIRKDGKVRQDRSEQLIRG